MSDTSIKKRGAIAGAAAGFALGACVTSVLLVLTSSSIILLLAVAPLALGYAGSTLGEKISFFGRRFAVVIAVSAVVLLAGLFMPNRVQTQRLQAIMDTSVPVYPGAELKESHIDAISGSRPPGFALVYGTEDPPEQILAYLRSEMVNQGWLEIDPAKSDLGLIFRFRKPGLMIHIVTDYPSFEFTIACAAYNLYHQYAPTALETVPLEQLPPTG